MNINKAYLVGAIIVGIFAMENGSYGKVNEKKVEAKKVSKHCGPFDPRCHHDKKNKS